MKKTILFSLLFLLASPAYAVVDWDKSLPAATDAKIDWPTDSQANNESLDRVLADYVSGGMRLNYSSATTISVSAGQVVCSNTAESLRKFRNNTASTNVTFTNLDTGTEEASKTYYVYAVADADAATATFVISENATTPSGVTYYKRLGSFYNDGISNITRINNDYNFSEVGEKVSKSFGTSYQALTDGMVIAAQTCGDPADGDMIGYTDSATPPTTAIASDSCNRSESVGISTVYSGLSFPVKAGDYYMVEQTASGTVSETLYFIPLQ